MITEDLEDVVTYEEYGFSISQPNLNTKTSRDESPNQSITNTTFIPTIQSNVIQQKQQHKSIFTYRKKFQPVSSNINLFDYHCLSYSNILFLFLRN